MTLTKGQIEACPFLIMVPEHYRPDGTCKCDCTVECARMVAEWGYTLEDFKREGVIE